MGTMFPATIGFRPVRVQDEPFPPEPWPEPTPPDEPPVPEPFPEPTPPEEPFTPDPVPSPTPPEFAG
jgi:hypothetical protein